jgi:hypothetical protein
MLISNYSLKSKDFSQLLLDCPVDLKKQLEDITANVEFDQQLCVRHPNYKPWEPLPEVRKRFQKLPQDAKWKHLAKHLRSFLYGIYYNGSLISVLQLRTQAETVTTELTVRNDSLIGIDIELFQKLHENNHGDGYFDPGWLVKKQESDRTLAVTKGKLTVHIHPEVHLMDVQGTANVGDVVSIKMTKNCIQDGFYIAVGNAGLIPINSTEEGYTTVRMYFNITPDGAVALMNDLTQQLNKQEILFSFKTPYNYSSYKRFDAGVLYFRKGDYQCVHPIIQNIYIKNKVYFRNNVPLFTKPLAPGVGLAEEPNYKFDSYESFGTNRCQVVANGLLLAQQQNQTSVEKKLSLILQQFAQLGIDLRYPYLNHASSDIYTPLQFE